MGELTIYGSSDDLIEIDGDITEEFSVPYDYNDAPTGYVAISDGTMLQYRYDNGGIWRFSLDTLGEGTVLSKAEGTSEPDTGTDTVTLKRDGKFLWVALAKVRYR